MDPKIWVHRLKHNYLSNVSHLTILQAVHHCFVSRSSLKFVNNFCRVQKEHSADGPSLKLLNKLFSFDHCFSHPIKFLKVLSNSEHRIELFLL